MNRLADKVALVIGGASGIGLAIARRFAAEGADTTLTGRREPDLQAALAGMEGIARTVAVDASDVPALRGAIARVHAERGRLDVLVVNAGLAEHGPLAEITEAHFDRTVGLNLRALLFAVQAAAPVMQPGGSIVLIGSIAGDIGNPGFGVYSATKAAVRGLARTLQAELASAGLRVNVVSPGPIDTPLLADLPHEARAAMKAQIPLGRIGTPDEVAAVALFLASDESGFVAGADYAVDGGLAQL